MRIAKHPHHTAKRASDSTLTVTRDLTVTANKSEN
jgi:hypothetical protein